MEEPWRLGAAVEEGDLLRGGALRLVSAGRELLLCVR